MKNLAYVDLYQPKIQILDSIDRDELNLPQGKKENIKSNEKSEHSQYNSGSSQENSGSSQENSGSFQGESYKSNLSS